MRAGKKITARLEQRVRAYEVMIASRARDTKVQQRKESGGYKRPGSRQKRAR